MESPKGARESVTRPSPIEHVDMHEVSAEVQDHSEDFTDARPIDPLVDTLDISDGSLIDVDVTEINSQESVEPVQVLKDTVVKRDRGACWIKRHEITYGRRII